MAPSGAWLAELRSELRAELYRELSRELGCEVKGMAQEVAGMRAAYEGQARAATQTVARLSVRSDCCCAQKVVMDRPPVARAQQDMDHEWSTSFSVDGCFTKCDAGVLLRQHEPAWEPCTCLNIYVPPRLRSCTTTWRQPRAA